MSEDNKIDDFEQIKKVNALTELLKSGHEDKLPSIEDALIRGAQKGDSDCLNLLREIFNTKDDSKA
jgi:hypothetical protein